MVSWFRRVIDKSEKQFARQFLEWENLGPIDLSRINFLLRSWTYSDGCQTSHASELKKIQNKKDRILEKHDRTKISSKNSRYEWHIKRCVILNFSTLNLLELLGIKMIEKSLRDFFIDGVVKGKRELPYVGCVTLFCSNPCKELIHPFEWCVVWWYPSSDISWIIKCITVTQKRWFAKKEYYYANEQHFTHWRRGKQWMKFNYGIREALLCESVTVSAKRYRRRKKRFAPEKQWHTII